MNRLRVAISVVTFISWCAPLSLAQTGCKPQDPGGYVEGFASSQQPGKVNVSLNLHCDSGLYSGELRLRLAAGSDIVTEAALEDGAMRRHSVAADDKGSPELRRTSDAKTSSSAETLSLTKAQWHEDLAFFARELPKRHANAFHSISRERFEAEVGELDQRLDQLNSDEIYVGMDRIANLIGDGHTYIRFPEDYAHLPINIARFGDDYRVVATANGNEKALGARVIKIADTPTARAHEMLLALTPSDETGVLRNARANGFLTAGILLHGIGIVRDRNLVRYAFADDDGKEFTVDVHSVTRSEKPNWAYPYKEAPLFRQRPDEDFWYTYVPESHSVYCSFRGYKDLGQHSKGLFDLINQQHPDKLVIDMRMNGGGDYNVGLRHMVHPIRDIADINRKGHLFVLIGPDTFSAAMSNSAHFRYQTNAILVGQQIGEKPNSYQEAREMKLPNSHWTVRYSVKFYKFVDNGENLIRPDQEIIPSWDDYKSAHDPVLDWVLNYKQ